MKVDFTLFNMPIFSAKTNAVTVTVGEVAYVELFVDENDKPRGCGIVEFETVESAQLAVEKMHRYELKGRKLVVKEVSHFAWKFWKTFFFDFHQIFDQNIF